MGELDSFRGNVVPLRKDVLPQFSDDVNIIVDPFLKPQNNFIDPSLFGGNVLPLRCFPLFQSQGCFEISVPAGKTLDDVIRDMAQSFNNTGALEY